MRGSRNRVVAATVGAVLLGAVAVTDWVVGGVSESGAPAVAMAAAHVVGYLLLLPVAAALRRQHAPVLGRVGRAALTVLVGSLVAMTAGFSGLLLVGGTGAVELLAGLGFLGMFVAALVAGVALWRAGAASTVAAILFTAPVPLLGVLVALQALGIVESHPALMEAAVYLGIAVAGHERLTAPQPEAPRRTAPV